MQFQTGPSSKCLTANVASKVSLLVSPPEVIGEMQFPVKVFCTDTTRQDFAFNVRACVQVPRVFQFFQCCIGMHINLLPRMIEIHFLIQTDDERGFLDCFRFSLTRMHIVLVMIQISSSVKRLLTNFTGKAFLLVCGPHVGQQLGLYLEGFGANFTLENWKSVIPMLDCSEMKLKVFPLAKKFGTEATFQSLLLVRAPHVIGERVFTSKDLMTQSAIEFGLGNIMTLFKHFSLVNPVRGFVLDVGSISTGFFLRRLQW